MPDGSTSVPASVPSAGPELRWVEQLNGPIERYHQAMTVQAPSELGLAQLNTVVQTLLDHHDGLRLRLDRYGPQWRVEAQPVGTVAAADCIHRIELALLESPDPVDAAAWATRNAADRLDPDAGLVLQLVWLDAGAGRTSRIVVVLHQFAVHEVPWRVLLPDLAAACIAVAHRRGKPKKKGKKKAVAAPDR